MISVFIIPITQFLILLSRPVHSKEFGTVPDNQDAAVPRYLLNFAAVRHLREAQKEWSGMLDEEKLRLMGEIRRLPQKPKQALPLPPPYIGEPHCCAVGLCFHNFLALNKTEMGSIFAFFALSLIFPSACIVSSSVCSTICSITNPAFAKALT